jgi:myosin heavy subunit
MCYRDPVLEPWCPYLDVNRQPKVRHYAEDVTYQCQGSFTAKNDNTVPRGLTLALFASDTSLVVRMAQLAEESADARAVLARQVKPTPYSYNQRVPSAAKGFKPKRLLLHSL